MEELNMSSCSFMSEGEEKNSVASDKLSTAESNADKEHLAEVNRQLTSTIDTLKQQLKDAMDATSSLNGMNETISQLRNELSDSREKEKQLAKEIRRLTNENEADQQQHQEEISNLNQQLQAANDKVAQEVEKASKIKKEKKALKEDYDEKT